MSWAKWTTGWQRLSSVLRSTQDEREDAEAARLLDGVDALHADTAQSTPILQASDDTACPCCAGKRCWSWRQSKHTTGCGGHCEDDKCWRADEVGTRFDGCGGEAEPVPVDVSFRQLMDSTVISPGRHTLRYVAKYAVAWGWNPISLRTRVTLWPAAYAQKFGRPIQIGRMRLSGALP